MERKNSPATDAAPSRRFVRVALLEAARLYKEAAKLYVKAVADDPESEHGRGSTDGTRVAARV
jgi:hypothetical protein